MWNVKTFAVVAALLGTTIKPKPKTKLNHLSAEDAREMGRDVELEVFSPPFRV